MSDVAARLQANGRYLVSNRIGLAYLKALDAMLSLRRAPNREIPEKISSLLIGVGGHLGDAIIATSLLPAIRRACPDTRIGVAAASWAMPAFQGHPLVEWTHVVDHWKPNRGSIGRLKKLRRAIATRRSARDEIRAVHYDAALDLYPFYPNMSSLFADAGIPIRVGYESGGGGPAFTHRLAWHAPEGHFSQAFFRVAAELIGKLDGPAAYSLPDLDPADDAIARQHLGQRAANGFVVLHPGTGDVRKEWPMDSWLAVARRLVRLGNEVVVTGAGAAECAIARWIALHEPAVLNLCGRTTFGQLRAIFRRARVIVACDSAAGHIAAAEGASVVSIMRGPGDPERWRPLADGGDVLVEVGGRDVPADRVIDAVLHHS
jgi:ADP-heptose:LPS heptosyltransferase